MTIPPHVQFSFNVRGLVHHASREAKLNYIKHVIKEYKPDIIHIQEHHFKSNCDLMKAFRRFGGRVVGVSLANADDPYAGVLSLIPPNSALLTVPGGGSHCIPLWALCSDKNKIPH